MKKTPSLFTIFILAVTFACQNKNSTPTHDSIMATITSSKVSKDFAVSDSLLEKAYLESNTIRDTGLMALSRVVQGNLYLKNRKFDSSLEILMKALDLLKYIENDTLKISCYGIIGNNHLQKSRTLEREYHLNKALEYFKPALSLGLQLKDSSRVGTTEINIGIIYKSLNNIDSSFIHFENASHYLENSENRNLKATADFNLAQLYLYIGNLREALEYNKRALAIYEKISGDEINQCQAYLHLGDIFRVGGQLDSAVYYYEVSLVTSDSISVPVGKDLIKMRASDNLGVVFKEQGKLVKAKSSLDTALTLTNSLNDVYMAGHIHINIGNVLLEQDSFSSALSHFKESLSIFTNSNYSKGIGTSLGSIGKYYSQISKPDSAIYYYNESQKLHESTGDKINIVTDYLNLGISTFNKNKSKNVNQAIHYFEKGLELLKQIGSTKNKDELLINIAELYEFKGNYKKANQYFQEFISLRDSLNDLEISQKVALIEGQFNTERFSRIDKENKLEIQTLNLKNLQKSQQITNRNITIIITSLSILFLVTILIIRIRAYQRAKKDKQVIEQINEKLQQSNTQIEQRNKQVERLLQVLRHQVKNDFNRFGVQLDSFTNIPNVLKDVKENIKDLQMRAITQGKFYSLLYGKREDYQTIFLPQFLNKWIEEIMLTFGYTDLDMLIEKEFSVEPTILTDDGKTLALIIIEIVINSFKYAFNDGRKPHFIIKLYKSEDGKTTFFIKDNGNGFPTNFIKTDSSKISGIGLIKMLVKESLKGRVEIYSDHGAVFEITSSKFNSLPSDKQFS